MRGARLVRLWPLVLLLGGVGCVHREIEILSRPPGAEVQFDGRALTGPTPVRFPFTWYGHHEVVLTKPGYHRERLAVLVSPPWYQQFPLDFFSENVWPWALYDVRTYPFVLEKVVPLDALADDEKSAMKTGLIERARSFREEAREKLGAATPKKPDEAKEAEQAEEAVEK